MPWAVAVPERSVDSISRVALRTTSTRVGRDPAVLSLVAGAVTGGPQPQVRAVDDPRRAGSGARRLVGVLARRREVLPGRYTFGLTGVGRTASACGAGATSSGSSRGPVTGRRQVESVAYVVR